MGRLPAAIAIFLLCSSPAFAIEPLLPSATASLVRPAQGRIEGLKLRSGQTPAAWDPDEARAMAEFSGTFVRPGWNLLWGTEKIVPAELDGKPRPIEVQAGDSTFYSLGPDLRLRLALETKGAQQPLVLFAVGPKGEIQTEKIEVRAQGTELFVGAIRRAPKFSWLTAGLGVTSISYRETGVPDFSMLALSAKVAARIFPSWRRVEVGAAGFITALPLSDSRTDLDVRFVGLNLRVGYILPFVRSPWRVCVMTGSYYSTMLPTKRLFGYRNMSGPQLYPTLQRVFDDGSVASAYVKGSLMMKGLSVLPVSNHELAIGGGYSRALRNRHLAGVTLDLAQYALDATGPSIRSTSLTFGISYGF